MLKKVGIATFLVLFCSTGVFSQGGMRDAIDVLNAGIGFYQEDKMEEATDKFESAAASFTTILEGVIPQEDKAYSNYYLATAKYYLGRIKKQKELFSEASEDFQKSIQGFKAIDLLGEEYLRSKYMRALCSFRQYQTERGTKSQIRFLESAIGDFEEFLTDEQLEEREEDLLDIIENAKFLKAFCKYKIGSLKMGNKSGFSNAKTMFSEALDEFGALEKASTEIIAIASQFLEAELHYMTARLYMQVDDEGWKDAKLSKKTRPDAIEEELTSAIETMQKVVPKSSGYKDVQKLAKLNINSYKVALGSIGDKSSVNDALSALLELKGSKTYGNFAALRIADAQLLQFLIFEGSINSVSTTYSRVFSKFPEGKYWLGWAYFTLGEFDNALSNFNSFLAHAPKDEIRFKYMEADAKLRQAESMFWKGVKENNLTLLSQASTIYKSLANPKGIYFNYLTNKQISIANLRNFLIQIETTLSGEKNPEMLKSAMEMNDIKLPGDADTYIETGRYFLEKGINSAEKERADALSFAQKAFDLVIASGGVDGDTKNVARFLKGVTIVKLSTLYEGAEQAEVAERARAVLDQCREPYSNEAKYVKGMSYFIENNYSDAKAIFSTLKSKGHIRAAFYYALSSRGACTTQAGIFMGIKNAIKDRSDWWYQSAELELAKLACRSSATAASIPSGLKDAPMTYENLVDKKADQARKKKECKFLWQKISSFNPIIELDKVITDKPPKTNVTLTLLVQPVCVGASVAIDGDTTLAKKGEGCVYKADVTRGRHNVVVKVNGFYTWKGETKVSKAETKTITLAKAVRFAKAGEVEHIGKECAGIATTGEELFALDNFQHKVAIVDKSGSYKSAIGYDTLKLGYGTELVIDGENLIIVDSRRNRVMRTDVSAEMPEILVYPGEEYGDAPLNKPIGVAFDEEDGLLYIVDSGNKRILKFEGTSYRDNFGSDELVQPYGIAINPVNGNLYVTDWGDGSVKIYTPAGEFVKKYEIGGYPTGIYISESGFIFIGDILADTVYMFAPDMSPLPPAATDAVSPRGVTMIGEGPDATLFISGESGVSLYKASWDNTYIPR